MFLFSFLTEAAVFIYTLKQQVDKNAGECGRKYRGKQGLPLKTPPTQVAPWLSMVGDHQADMFTDVEFFPLYLSDTGRLDY